MPLHGDCAPTANLDRGIMSEYPTAPPPPERQSQPATAEPPPAIQTSVTIIWAVVALAVVSTLLTFFYLDDLVDAAGTDLTGAQEDAARTGGIIGAVIGFVIFGAVWAALAVFLRKGANWARIVLTVLVVLGLALSVFSLLAGNQPAIFLILGLINIALYVALVYFMWQQESTAYLTAPKPH